MLQVLLMYKSDRLSEELKPCECNCGELIHAYLIHGLKKRFHRYKIGHQNNGKKLSIDTKNKISTANSGEKNGLWKKDNVGIGALHAYVKRHLSKPKLCQICNKSPVYDLANVSGKYLRDLSDWYWLCRRCHMLSDGRMDNLVQFKK